MNGVILCPRCEEFGRKPKVLAKYEDIRGTGIVKFWCKKCGKEIHINIDEYSLDR